MKMENAISDSMEISKLFRDFEKARELNLENLQKILRDNKDTKYGRRLSFAGISSEEDYRRQVPVTRYEDYNGLCEHNRYTVYPVRYTIATSGSTGRRKVFPLTGEALDRYGDYIYSMPYLFFGGKSGPHIHTSVFRLRENGDNLLYSAYFGELRERGYLRVCCVRCFPKASANFCPYRLSSPLRGNLWDSCRQSPDR